MDDDILYTILLSISEDNLSVVLEEEGYQCVWDPNTQSFSIADVPSSQINYLLNSLDIIDGDGYKQAASCQVKLLDDKRMEVPLTYFDINSPLLIDASDNNYDVIRDLSSQGVQGFPESFDFAALDIIYEETNGSDLFESFVDEQINYEIDVQDGRNIYKLFKESFAEEDSMEIWGYNFNLDKVDIAALIEKREINKIAIENVNEDIHVSIMDTHNQYKIVFKDSYIEEGKLSLDILFNYAIVSDYGGA